MTTSITCRKCGQEGSIVWEIAAGKSRRPAILSISDGFYRRVRGNHSAAPHLICDSCGTIVKNAALAVPQALASEG